LLKKTKYLLMMLVATCVAASSLYAQSSSTIGTEYWFGFMPNKTTVSDRIVLVASSPTPTQITVETYLGDSSRVKTETYTLTPLKFGDTIGTLTIDLTPHLSETHQYERPTYQAVHVSSSAPISLSGYNYKRGSGEGMLILPVTTYGKEYRTLNYPTFRIETDAYPGQFMIISPYDDNTVTITAKGYTENSDGIESHAPGNSWQVNLRKGQTYLVRSSTKYSTNQSMTDLTGSYITSTKPVSVISGHEYTKIDAQYGSTFFEMLPPVESWSKKYYYDNYDPQRKSTVVFVAADTGDFYYTVGTGTSTPVHLNAGDRSEEEQFVGAGLLAITSSNSRFLAYELRRSKDIATDKKNYPPSMTLFTTPDNKAKTRISNQPPPLLSRWYGCS